MSTQPELHLFIIWSQGRHKEKKILKDLSESVEILEIIEVHWPQEKAFRHFCRFYAANFQKHQEDIAGRGLGSFLLLTFIDHNPIYRISDTSSGHAYVNTNILSLKNKYRSWLDNEFAIHSTVTVDETKNDLFLLLGITYEEYLRDHLAKKKETPIKRDLHGDLMGSDGWRDMREVLQALNETSCYTMLRDFTSCADELGQTSDIDILVDDKTLETIPFILNAKKEEDEVKGTYVCQVVVGKHLIPFHLHTDSYLMPGWVSDILHTRYLGPNGIYLPSKENQFYSLFYQLLYKKMIVKRKYKDFLKDIYRDIFPKDDEKNNHFDRYIDKLNHFIGEKKYTPIIHDHVRPHPMDLLKIIEPKIQNLGISKIKPYKLDLWKPGKGAKLFEGELQDHGKVLIKYFGQNGVLKNEFKLLKFLNGIKEINTPQAFYYKSSRAGHQMIVMAFLHGQSLEDIDFPHLDESTQQRVIQGICDVILTYQKYGLIHRDVDPANIFIDKDGKVFFIDYEYMIDTKHIALKNNNDYLHPLVSLYNLGAPNNPGPLKWNDAYSAIKILQSYEPNFPRKYPDLYEKLNALAFDATMTYTLKKDFCYLKKRIKHILSVLIKRLSKIFFYFVARVNE